MSDLRYHTDFTYTGRSDKPRYIVEKYGYEVLSESVLDVGADQCLLGNYLQSETDYLGIGLSDTVDERVDLEVDKVPYDDESFNCVVCVDVLEHVENIHEVFDELCRVSGRYVIISLPNPWASFMGMLRDGYADGDRRPMKFYNLPTEAPVDRHKWFYGAHEAVGFIRERAEMNGARVVQLDREWSVENRWKRRFYELTLGFIFHDDVNVKSLTSGNIWALLEV